MVQLGGNVEEEASAAVKTEASEQPAALTLDVEDIKSAVADARLDRKSPKESLIAATLPKPLSTPTAAKGKAALVKAEGAHAKKADTVSAKVESGAQRGKKKPAKGKAIEVYDPAHIDRAFDMMSSGASSVREHNLQKVRRPSGHESCILHVVLIEGLGCSSSLREHNLQKVRRPSGHEICIPHVVLIY